MVELLLVGSLTRDVTVLRRADGAGGVPLADLIAALRGLQAVGLAAIRAGVEEGAFAADLPLRAALEARMPRPLAGAEGTAAAPLLAERVGVTLSACWALLTVGWPADAALEPAALRRATEREWALLGRRGGSPAEGRSRRP